MKRILVLLLLAVSTSGMLQAQVVYEEFASERLGENRKLKIQLPRSYNSEQDKVYPIVIALDGNYLFEPVAGNVDYYSYWEDMPEAIVVGIMQTGDQRYDDCYYDDTEFFPAETGAAFFEFVGMELIPFLDDNYRTAKFVIAVGHDFTANFINYYLFKEPPLFQGYISLSPDLAPLMDERLAERLPSIEDKIFYYLATGTDDVKDLMDISVDLNERLKVIDSPNLQYYFDNFEGATHYSLVGRAIPRALEQIFQVYRPISKKEYKEVLLKLPGSPYDYLMEKYATIKELFGLENTIRVKDIIAVATAAEKTQKWEALGQIAKLARSQYPDTVLGDYYLARHYEEMGEPKKAMRTYQGAYDKEEVDFITIDLMLDKADKIKEDFGW
ncbi:alpha/beta hydrolase [Gilvibacter sediminis]|uniref:alpha/beta hydrolase n=1 Tax=Gilvibacter sediminis TaxID=379071 RepID=UPI002350AFF5|nr:alpha/beta hydrolase-fold protein [Gilvibacter sediminis]MDC7997119.1 alpha/beta hydrolase-fold protein [Gilvibacter sediminis]